MELAHAVALLLFVPVAMQILLPLALLLAFAVLTIAREIFAMSYKPGIESRSASSIAQQNVR